MKLRFSCLLPLVFCVAHFVFAQSPQPPGTGSGHTGTVTAVCFSPDGKTLASAGRDGQVIVWDLLSGAELRSIDDHADIVCFLPGTRKFAYNDWTWLYIADVSPDQSQLSFENGQIPAGGHDETVVFADPAHVTVAVPDASTNAAEISEWQWIVPTKVSIYTLTPGPMWKNMASITIPGLGQSELVLSPNGSMVAGLLFGDGVWSARTGKKLYSFSNPDLMSEAAAFSRSCTKLAVSFGDTCELMDAHKGTVLFTLNAGYSDAIAFSPDGSRVAVGTTGEVRIYNVTTGALVKQLPAGTTDVKAVQFSPNGALVAAGSEDHAIRIWNVSDGKLIRTLGAPETLTPDMLKAPAI